MRRTGTETRRQDSSAARCVIAFFDGRNSQLFKEAGRGAAGPVISHSWLTVMTDFSCPGASAFKSFHTQPATHSYNWLPKNKVVWTVSLGEVYSGKRVLLWNQQEYTAQRQREAAGRLQLHSYTRVLINIRLVNFEYVLACWCCWNGV